MNGILIVNKPLNYTSMDIIRRMRRLTQIKRIGHAGTLDPLATGVLIVCIGKATKLVESLMNQKKEYIAEIKLDAFSETDDLEGELTVVNINNIPTIQDIEKVLLGFMGEIYQTPPKYSAVKINGIAAYKHARNNNDIKMVPKLISIYNIKIMSYEWPILKIRINCGRGTYIRSLARDIGTKLNTGGYLISLIRTEVGIYNINNSVDIFSLNEIKESDLISVI